MGTPFNERKVGRRGCIPGIHGDRVSSAHLSCVVRKFTRLDRLTVANEMLSLLGSLQDDPFSPEHTAERAKTVLGESEIEDIEVEREVEPSAEEEEDEIESDRDTFVMLGKMSDKAAAARGKAEGGKSKRKGNREEGKNKLKRKKTDI